MQYTEKMNNNTGHGCQVFVANGTRKSISLVALICIMLFILASNSLMMIGLWKTIKKFQLVQLLLFMQSCLGLAIGIIAIPARVALILFGSKSKCFLVALEGFFGVSLNLYFGLNLVTLTYARYNRVTNLKKRKNLSYKSIYKLRLLALLYTLTMAVWYATNSQMNNLMVTQIILLVLAVTSLVCVAAILYIDFHLIRFLRKTVQQNSLKTIHEKTNRYQAQQTKVILVMSLMLVLCFCPTAVAWVVAGIALVVNYDMKFSFLNLVNATYMTILLNAGLHSVIYSFCSKNVKTYYKSFFTLNSIRGLSRIGYTT